MQQRACLLQPSGSDAVVSDDTILADALRGVEERLDAAIRDARKTHAEAVLRTQCLLHSPRIRPCDRHPDQLHVTVARDPLPTVYLNHAQAAVNLEADLAEDRVEATAAHHSAWIAWWHRVGRASDIVRVPEATESSCTGPSDEVFLEVARPGGRRTRFQALSSLPSLARPVSATIKRVKPPNSHRSVHYPHAPSAARLSNLASRDRYDAVDCAAPIGSTGKHDGSDAHLGHWKRKMGLL